MAEQADHARLATDPRSQRLAAITVVTSLIVWWPAYTLGVYNMIFFEQVFALGRRRSCSPDYCSDGRRSESKSQLPRSRRAERDRI